MTMQRLSTACLIVAMPVLAQRPAPGGPSINAAHIHLNASDADKSLAFWKDFIGASAYSNGSVKGVGMLGGTVLVTAKAPSGPSTGSAIDHLGMKVPDIDVYAEKAKKANFKSFRPKPDEERLMIDGPDGVRIELISDSDMYTTIEFNHVHVSSPQPKETQAWYAKHFGGRPGNIEGAESWSVQGMNLIFVQGDAKPSVDRAIDHIAFEVKDLAGFCKKLTEDGLKLDVQPHADAELKATVAMLTDPSGTRIELIEPGVR
jgi:catechol 2,3-dioxygenase-like lactoylglutathione lyase family enzyme